MMIQDRGSLKSQAGNALSRCGYDPKKLVLIHSGVTALFTTLVLCLNYLLEEKIGTTGGLDGIGIRSMLSTVQSLLSVVQLFLLPLWQIGYLSAMLRVTRDEPVSHLTLLDGFRSWGAVIRLNLLRFFVYAVLVLPIGYGAGFVFLATPWGTEMMEKMMPFLTDPSLSATEAGAEAMVSAFAPYRVPLLCVFGLLFTLACLPIFYRFRMSDFALMDHPEKGALSALRESRSMMRGRCVDLFKLDLSFWWYYLLEALSALLVYGDMIAEALGISLPLNPAVRYFLFFFLSQIAGIGLYWWRKNEVTATYAQVYGAISTAPPRAKPAPRKVPWENPE